jgi:hypothetical protein
MTLLEQYARIVGDNVIDQLHQLAESLKGLSIAIPPGKAAGSPRY